ncbi:hypothetical protein cypCar_00038387 [Cyprinus carpio]|nr:hypothetical protein cypCar_00038387 [Cyprinus carpio]
MCSVIREKTNFAGSSCSVMWYLSIVFTFTVYGTHGCVITSPDQKANAGTDVHLSCNFWQCPGPLDIMSLSVEWEFKPKIILYYIRNRTVPLPALTRRNNPGVNHLQKRPPWLLPLASVASVAGFVLLIGTVFWGRKAYTSTQRENNSKQNMEEAKTSTDAEDKGIIYKVGFSMPDLADVNSPPSSPDNIYVTMHGLPFAPDVPATAGRNRRLPSDWQLKDEEPVFVR